MFEICIVYFGKNSTSLQRNGMAAIPKIAPNHAKNEIGTKSLFPLIVIQAQICSSLLIIVKLVCPLFTKISRIQSTLPNDM